MKSLSEIRDELDMARHLVTGGTLAATSRDLAYGGSPEQMNGIAAVLYAASDRLAEISKELGEHVATEKTREAN